MNYSTKFNFSLPENTDPLDINDITANFETIDANLLTEEQSLSSTQKNNARTNIGLGSAATKDTANNLTTSASGSVLDARQGKALKDSLDATDAAVAQINGALAIVASGNTAPSSISKGQFVLWGGDLYRASSAISSGATLSSSNLTAVPKGGFNSLRADINTLDSNKADKTEIPGYYRLVSNTTLGTSYESVSTYNSRKFSDYPILLFVLFREGSWILGSLMCRGADFIDYTGVAIVGFWGSTRIEADVKYSSDTSCQVKYICDSTQNVKVGVFGFSFA